METPDGPGHQFRKSSPFLAFLSKDFSVNARVKGNVLVDKRVLSFTASVTQCAATKVLVGPAEDEVLQSGKHALRRDEDRQY